MKFFFAVLTLVLISAVTLPQKLRASDSATYSLRKNTSFNLANARRTLPLAPSAAAPAVPVVRDLAGKASH